MKSSQPFQGLRKLEPEIPKDMPAGVKYNVPPPTELVKEPIKSNLDPTSNSLITKVDPMDPNAIGDQWAPGADQPDEFQKIMEEGIAKLETKLPEDAPPPKVKKFSILGSRREQELVGEVADGPVTSFGLELPDNEIMTKTQYKTSIYDYKNHFGHCLESFDERLTKEHIESLDIDGLEQLYQEVRIAVGSRNSADLIPLAVNMVSLIPEKYGHLVGLDLEGFAAQVQLSQSLKENIMELSIEYKKYIYIHPLYRFGLNYFQLLMNTNNENKQKKMLLEVLSTTVDPLALEEFRDL